MESLQKIIRLGWHHEAGARVVSIGSINQAHPKNVVSAYAAAKAAQRNPVQSRAQAYAKQGLLLNTIAPGLIDKQSQPQTRRPRGWGKMCARSELDGP